MASHSNSAQHHGGPSSNSSSSEECLHVLVPSKTFQEIQNHSDRRTNPNPLRYLLIFIYIPWHVCTSRNQHFFKRRHLLSPCVCKWNCFWWRTRKCQPSKFFPKAYSTAFIKHLGFGQSGKPNSTQKVAWPNSDKSALCKLRKKYMTKNMKEVCQLDSNPLIQALSSSSSVPTSMFLASFLGTLSISQKAGGA